MAEINNFVAASNGVFISINERNYPDDGLADDDSWVENISQGGDDCNEFDSVSESNPETDREEDLRGYNCNGIDFTLHTIVEESCEESELELGKNGEHVLEDSKSGDHARISPSDLERYFFFGLGDGDRSDTLEDSSSEICSDCSDHLDVETNDVYLGDTESALELSTSRLEKYFLSGFMGFSAENKSDGSVGSDSEGQPSPSQRKKKFVRARGTPRSNHSSLDNLLVESLESQADQSTESLYSSESETGSVLEDGAICDKIEIIDTVKRKKNYRKREVLEQRLFLESGKATNFGHTDPTVKNLDNASSNDYHELQVLNINGLTRTLPAKTSLVRKDSFNNWSSDEETNLMMSKMRQFFKTIIAVTTQNYNQTNNFGSYSEQIFKERNNQLKPKTFQFPYFENELIRLMKTVPGINNQRVREIVEYFSSEDTWSDSNDSSDCYGPNMDVVSKKSKKYEHLHRSKEKKIACTDVNDGKVDEPSVFNTETALVYKNLIESLLVNNSKLSPEILNIDEKCNNHIYSDKSPQLLANVMQHIGKKLVALMHEVSIGNDTTAPNQELNQSNDITSTEDSSTKIVLDNLDCSPSSLPNPLGNLPRSKSHDILLGSTNRSWQFNSSSAVNDNAGEVSDCDRFSWRGSFESALLAPGDSRNKLLTVDRDNCSHTSDVSISKRGSVDNLSYNIIQNGEQLDRVQSCGSIGVIDKQRCTEGQKLWLSSLSDIKNNTDLESPSPRLIKENLACSNSLSRLQSIEFSSNISDKSQSDSSVVQPNAKSARYRSPVVQTDIFSSVSKKNDVPQSAQYTSNNLQNSSASSTSFDDFFLPEFSSNVNKSPGLQRNHFYKRNNTGFGKRSDSLTSVYSDAFDHRYGIVKVKGQVEFAMQYNYKISAFEIHIVKCKDLAAVDTKRNKSDPYVKVYLLPDKSKSGKRKTKVKKHTLNPVFDEIMRFYVSISTLETRSIWLTVWHSDMFGRNDFLGEVTIDLQGKVFDNPQSQWYLLQEKNGKFDENLGYRGDIVVGLKFISLESSQVSTSDASLNKTGTIKPHFKGQLHVLIKEAKNLQSLRASGTCDPFCKSYLLPNRARGSKQKTPVVKRSLNPLWNFTFVYEDVTLEELSERALELTIWDHDRLISNQFLGGARFSLGTGKHYGNKVNWMDSNGKELFLWQDMINRPNFWVEGSVNLRSNLDVKRDESIES